MRPIWNLLKASKKPTAFGITVMILYLSLAKIQGHKIEINNADKLYHSIAYFFLTIAWLFAFAKKTSQIYWITLGCVLFGIVIEGLQVVLTNYRSGDFVDILANTLGSVIALLRYNYFFKKI